MNDPLNLLVQTAFQRIADEVQVDDPDEEARLDEAARAFALTRAQEIQALEPEQAAEAIAQWRFELGLP